MSFGSTMQLVRDVATFVIIIVVVIAMTYGYFSWKHQSKITGGDVTNNNSMGGYKGKSIPFIGAWFGNGRTCYHNQVKISCSEMDSMIISEYGE